MASASAVFHASFIPRVPGCAPALPGHRGLSNEAGSDEKIKLQQFFAAKIAPPIEPVGQSEFGHIIRVHGGLYQSLILLLDFVFEGVGDMDRRERAEFL